MRAAAAGVLADHLVGEPPLDPHPVALFGRAMRGVERRLYADSRRAGVGHAVAGVALGTAAGAALGAADAAVTAGGNVASALPTAAATYLAVAGRALRDAAADVRGPLEAGDLVTARHRLRALAGRDASGLDAKELARAVVESLAENTVDAVVAPALWAAALGAPGALAYRAVNTLDAMVGHRSARYARYGWASARLDDAANWIPARVTAALVGLVRPRRANAVWATVRHQAGSHPSPNAGVAEAAFAAALGLRLGGTNRYGDRLELRPHLGDGRPAEPGDIGPAAVLSRDVTLALAALLAVGGSRR
ncbi:MAG TPA: adenosylcobinamide-phosphate synthase CbiB [Acidimicrobiales bacterium]